MSANLIRTPLAIVGMACRLPGADDLEEYWDLLRTGRDAIVELPADRLDRGMYYDPAKGVRCKTYSTLGGLIKDRPVEGQYSHLGPGELQKYDPCHQIFCETVAQACRDAGYDPDRFPYRNTGIYIGHSGGSSLGGELAVASLAEETADYLRDVDAFAALPSDVQEQVIAAVVDRLRANRPRRDPNGGPDLAANTAAALTARMLGVDGPQMTIDAACASSLAALAFGAMALADGRVDMAVIGGASYSKADSLVLFSQAQSCTASGSRPFDARADGLVSSEGYVALAVKTLARAQADGDPIHGVIRGLGFSSDGLGRSLWAPRKEGQVEAMRRAYGPELDPRQVQYIEAHATSTQVGDATELQALREFFGSVQLPRQIPVGSVKSNIGHTLETAGLASLLKVVLAMKHGVVPPTIHVQEPNPDIPWGEMPFYLALKQEEWTSNDQPRRAAVNAFGIGGVNVHVVVDACPLSPEKTGERGQAELMKSEPTALAAGLDLTVHEQVKPEASAYGSQRTEKEAIAVVGRGVVLPGAHSVEEFAQLIDRGGDAFSSAPESRWRRTIGVRPGDPRPWQTPTCRGGFVRDYQFDWRRHQIPPKQIAQANPLQFMLLDATYQALDEAGYDESRLGAVQAAVVVGTIFGGEFGHQLHVGLRLPELRSILEDELGRRQLPASRIRPLLDEYEELLLRAKPALLDRTGSFTSSTLATRIAKTLNLMGGAMAVDAGESSSLAAVEAASDLLRTGACSLVLCGAAQHAMDLPAFEELALRGSLETEDAESDHERFLPGEGVVVTALKRLSDAQRDGDRVFAVLHGHGVATGKGASETAAQRALQAANCPPERVERIFSDCGQSRLSGTDAGALEKVYGRRAEAPLLVRQIGDTQAAHGLATLVWATLVDSGPLSDGRPGASAFRSQDSSQQTTATPDASSAERRLTALTTHGTNGLVHHLLWETISSAQPQPVRVEAPATTFDLSSPLPQLVRAKDVASTPDAAVNDVERSAFRYPTSEPPTAKRGLPASKPQTARVIRLGASHPAALSTQLEQVAANPDAFFAAGNTPFSAVHICRAAIVAEDPTGLAEKAALAVHKWRQPESQVVLHEQGIFCWSRASEVPRVAFLFPGQGSQYSGMLRALVEQSPAVRIKLAEADAILRRLNSETFAELAWTDSPRLGTDLWNTQAAVLLADVFWQVALREQGIRPDVVTGHSFGEVPALVAAGSWTLEQALRMTRSRTDSILASRMGPSGMLAISAPAEIVAALLEEHCPLTLTLSPEKIGESGQAEPLIPTLSPEKTGARGQGVYLTHRNAPRQTVVGGDLAAVERFAQVVKANKLAAQILHVPCAFHTPLLHEAQKPWQRILDQERVLPPTIPLLSNVFNRYVAEPEEIRSNLVAQLTEPVRYPQLVDRLAADGAALLIEVGPKQTLTQFNRRILAGKAAICLATDHPTHDVATQLMHIRAALECMGLDDRMDGSGSTQGTSAAATSDAGKTQAIEHFDAMTRRRERKRAAANANGSTAHSGTRQAFRPAQKSEPTVRSMGPRPVENEVNPRPGGPCYVPAPEASADDSSAPATPPAVSAERIESAQQFLLDFVVEETGFPPDVVDLDSDLEAHLGIDSIKKAQLIGELSEMAGLDLQDAMHLGPLQTLRDIAQLVVGPDDRSGQPADGRSGILQSAGGAADAAPRSGERSDYDGPRSGERSYGIGPASDDGGPRAGEAAEFLIDFVVEETGFPRDVVDLDADLEANLGIDSIKKAQLVGELASRFEIVAAEQDAMLLGQYSTLREVLALLEESDAESNVGQVSDLPTEPASIVENDAPVGDPYVGQVSSLPSHRASIVDSDAPVSEPYRRGFEHGRHHRDSIRNALRDWADQPWDTDIAASAISVPSSNGWPVAENTELKGIADGAAVHLDNLMVYQRFILDRRSEPSHPVLTNDEPTALAAGVNGGLDSQGRPEVSADRSMDPRLVETDVDPRPRGPSDVPTQVARPDRAEEAGADPTASRFILRTCPASPRRGAPTQPVFAGAAVIVGDNSLADAVQSSLEQQRVTVHRLLASDEPAEAVKALQQCWDQEQAPHLFLTTPHDADAVTALDWRAWQDRRPRGVMSPYWVCQRWLQLVQEAGLMDEATLVGVTALGGDFGFSSKGISAESGALSGLLKAILIEGWVHGFRTTPIKLIDAPPGAPPEEIVGAVWRELAAPSYDIEVAWRGARRHAVRAIPQPIDRQPRQPISPGSVWVCTGGARGVTARTARELGKRCGARLHLLGTSPSPQIPDEWRDLTPEQLRRLQEQVMRQARALGDSPIQAWRSTEKALEIDRTLRTLAADGIAATYHQCDVANYEALQAVLERIRHSDGPIEGILHGAGVGQDARFERKKPEKVEQCIGAKVDGALALMELTRNDPLKYFAAFGSISGRFGANGHTDYSLANDMLAKLVGWYRGQRPEVAAVAFHWHAWGDVGMAARPDTRLALEMIEMDFMPAAEGVQHLIAELEIGAPEAEVLITDEKYYRAFYPEETLARDAPRDVASRSRPPLLDGGRISQQEDWQVTEIELDPASEPFLREHRLDDKALLPVVVGLELLSEAAARLAHPSPLSKENGGEGTSSAAERPDVWFPERLSTVGALSHVQAVHALRFPNDQPQTVRVRARRERDQSITCELTADIRTRDGRIVESDRVYLKAKADLSPLPQKKLDEGPSHHVPECDWQPVHYEPRGSRFYLGSPLRCLRRIHIDGESAWGKIAAPALIELAGAKRSVEGWSVPSAALDACLYATGLLAWTSIEPGSALPVEIDRLQLGRLPHPGEACVVHSTIKRREHRRAWFDFTLFGDNGDQILKATDYGVAWLVS